MKYLITFLLFVIFLISGCATKTYTLNEGDIYIDSIEITNQKSCEEIETAMKTSDLARYGGYRVRSEAYTYIKPIEGLTEQNYACIIFPEKNYDTYLETGKAGAKGWKTGLNKAKYVVSFELNETTKLYFCCSIVNRAGEKISNDLCSEKILEKVC